MKKKIVLVSGCFDLLHAGHIAFFKQASSYGRLYVAVGADKNITLLKGKAPYFSQTERVYMVNAVRYVEEAFVASGSGVLDFEPDLKRIKPDIFIVNSDGHAEEKEKICRENNIEYLVLKRVPEKGLPARSSSAIKKGRGFPYRICLAGGWMDQPWVSQYYPGSVIVFQILPTIEFNDRSGMATSSRKVAIELWGNKLPAGDPVRNARLLFGAENPPGTQYVSGSQDQLGLLLPGINRLYYRGDYWPSKIDSTTEADIIAWLEHVIHLVPIKPRPDVYDPLKIKNLTTEWVKVLGEAGDLCWESILKKDITRLGYSLTRTLEAWQHLLPHTVLPETLAEVKNFKQYPGALFSGSGGGYLMVVSETPINGSLKVKIRTS
jgi:cytidyltransferase-like protein